jgi:hypothetical protein
LDTYPDSCNFDREIAEVFKKCLRDIADQIQDSIQRKERLERRFKVIHKNPIGDFISINIEWIINIKDIQIRQQKSNLEIPKKAFELIKGYKFDIEKLPDRSGFLEGFRPTQECKRRMAEMLGITDL